jgi:hypothetical protein
VPHASNSRTLRQQGNLHLLHFAVHIFATDWHTRKYDSASLHILRSTPVYERTT